MTDAELEIDRLIEEVRRLKAEKQEGWNAAAAWEADCATAEAGEKRALAQRDRALQLLLDTDEWRAYPPSEFAKEIDALLQECAECTETQKETP